MMAHSCLKKAEPLRTKVNVCNLSRGNATSIRPMLWHEFSAARDPETPGFETLFSITLLFARVD